MHQYLAERWPILWFGMPRIPKRKNAPNGMRIHPHKLHQTLLAEVNISMPGCKEPQEGGGVGLNQWTDGECTILALDLVKRFPRRCIAICYVPLFAWRFVALSNTKQIRDSKQKWRGNYSM